MSFAYAKAISSALISKMYKDGDIIVMGPSVFTSGRYGETEGIAQKFPTRIIECGIDDDANVRAALGMAMVGMRPAVFVNGKYLFRIMDALVNEAALTDEIYNSQFPSNMVILADVGAMPGRSAQENFLFEGLFCAVPNLKVVYPSSAEDANLILKDSLDQDGPVLFLMNEKLLREEGEFTKSEDVMFLGQANVVKEGDFATIITYGPMVKEAVLAAQTAQRASIECEIIDLVTLSPIDTAAIVRSVKKTGRVIIAHEGHKTCGLGAEINALITESSAFDYLERPIMRVCGKDAPLSYNEESYNSCIPSWNDIYEAIAQLA